MNLYAQVKTIRVCKKTIILYGSYSILEAKQDTYLIDGNQSTTDDMHGLAIRMLSEAIH